MVGYSQEQLFNLVLDIESYPAFVPGWEVARVTDRRESSYRTDQIIRLFAIRRLFRSVTTFERPHSIDVIGQGDGIKRFRMSWSFVTRDDGCEVGLQVDLGLSLRPLQRLAETAAQDTSRQMLTAFLLEAKRRFGSTAPGTPSRVLYAE